MGQSHLFIFNTLNDTRFLAKHLRDMLKPHVTNQSIKIGLIGHGGIGKSTLAKSIISDKPIRYEDMTEHGHNNQMSLVTPDLNHIRLYDMGTKKSPYDTFLKVARDENFREKNISGLDIIEHADLEQNQEDYCLLIRMKSSEENKRICTVEITEAGQKRLSTAAVSKFFKNTATLRRETNPVKQDFIIN